MSMHASPAGQASHGEDGVDLTTILDESQREELILLISSITGSMKKRVLENFDPSAGIEGLAARPELSEDEKLMNADPKADVHRLDQERKLKEANEKELASLKMQNLKKNSLKAFDEWRESVHRRITEAIETKTSNEEQFKEASDSTPLPRAPDTGGKVAEAPTRSAVLKFRDLFSPTKTPLTKLSMEKRTLILHSVLLLLISLEHYTAPSRILMLNLTSSLKLPLKTFEQDEYTTAKGLLEGAREMTAAEETKKKAEENKESRKWKVGLATAAGAAILGVTGGLAAPLVAAGVGSVMGGLGLGATAAAGYLGTVAGSTIVVGSLFGAYGGRMTGQMMDNYAREVEDFQFLPVHSRHKTSEDQKTGAKQASDHDHKLRVTICMSGWLTQKEEVVTPWRVLGTGAEVFALKYELESLLNLGNAMDSMVKSAAWGYAKKELISQTIFAELAAAMWPIGLMKIARVIDNPFSVAKSRAEKAGEVLADALINKVQGERPVTLIGYSLGARVIYRCLMSLAKRKAFGLIENVVMMGAPTPSDTSTWRVLRSVVAGRLVNVYAENDYILGFMYRTSAVQYGVAGLEKIRGLAGVENFDVSEDVKSHPKYRFLVGSILKKIGFEDINMDAVEEEYQALLKMEEEERKQSLQAQRKRLSRRKSTGGKEDEAAEAEFEASEMEKHIQAETQRSLMTRAIEYFYTPGAPSADDTKDTSGKVQKTIQNASKASTALGQSAKTTRDSTESYAQWVANKLPSMPGMGESGSKKGVKEILTSGAATASDGSKASGTKQSEIPSYSQRAASYLPSMPKNLPSMQSVSKNLPSMPNLQLRGQQSKSSKPAEVAKQTTQGASSAAQTTTNTVTDTMKPTLNNLAQPQENPAVAGAKPRTREAPIIHQASEPISKATLPSQSSTDQTEDRQSYMGKATSYLPSMPTMPSLSGVGGAGKGQEKKSGPSKLAQKPSGVKSPSSPLPSPNLPRTPSSSGVKSPPPKLDRQPSGVKSPATVARPPPPKLDRQPSGVKSPPPKLDRLPSGRGTVSASTTPNK